MTDISHVSAAGRQRTVADPPPFPRAIYQSGHLYFSRHATENYKLALAGIPPRDFEGPDELVPVKRIAVEFGVHRRTIYRRAALAEKAAQGEAGEVRLAPIGAEGRAAAKAAHAARSTPAARAEKAAIAARVTADKLAQVAKRRAAEAAAKAAEAAAIAKARYDRLAVSAARAAEEAAELEKAAKAARADAEKADQAAVP
jgi:hypothetical protein